MEASSLLDDATATQSARPSVSHPLEYPANSIQPDDNHSSTATTAISETASESLAHQSMTVSKSEFENSSSRVSDQVDEQFTKTDNQQDSSIRLKRCKHGRIIIKDLSRKKLAQQSDNGCNNISNKQGNESNNNHIISESTLPEINGTTKSETNRMGDPSQSDTPSELNHNSSSSILVHSQLNSQPCTASPKSQNPDAKSVDQISPLHTSKRDANRLILRAKARSRSSSRSLSPKPRNAKIAKSPARSPVRSPVRSQARRSRYSRSPRRDRSSISSRSSSRDRRQSSRRYYDSPSPRRRDRSFSPRRRKRRDRRSSRRRRTPERDRRADVSRDRRNSHSNRSPSRKLPRSRSITPPKDVDRRRNRRNSSRSISREPSRYDRYSNANHERSREQYDKAASLRSPVDHRLRGDASETPALENNISISKNNHENQSTIKQTVAQSSTKPPLAQVTAKRPPSPQRCSPERAQMAKTSPSASPMAPSPATPPSNDDSASSDIYDPEAPIIPISPCDSPPISPTVTDVDLSKTKIRVNSSEKNGEDDVPSSAVQLNQQEKYLQKLNRQERVIEEVKVALRPFYQNRSINKEQYKDVLRRAVPKICHSKDGEINPIKIGALVGAYVKKMKRH